MERCRKEAVVPTIVGCGTDEGGRALTSSILVHPKECATDGSWMVTFETPQNSYGNISLGLRGRHQVENAAIAIGLAEALGESGFVIDARAIISGLENASHRGRLELWRGAPSLLFDGAHNPDAARALRTYLDDSVSAPVTMIFGALKDKRFREMAEILFPLAENLVLTSVDNPRAVDTATLVEAAVDQAHVYVADTIAGAFAKAFEVTPPHGIICVTGSLYLVGTAQQYVRESRVGRVALTNYTA